VKATLIIEDMPDRDVRVEMFTDPPIDDARSTPAAIVAFAALQWALSISEGAKKQLALQRATKHLAERKERGQ